MTALWSRPSLAVAWLAASGSGVAVVLYALGWVSLGYSVALVAPLQALLFIGLLIRSGWRGEDVFATRLRAGLMAGMIGLLCYDGARQFIVSSGMLMSNPFRPVEIYGLLIVNGYQDPALARAVGWGFHIWNGLSFALMYTLALGRGRILWGIGWGMALELATLATYPSILRLALDREFLLVSLAGHVAYGLGMGATARHTVRC